MTRAQKWWTEQIDELHQRGWAPYHAAQAGGTKTEQKGKEKK